MGKTPVLSPTANKIQLGRNLLTLSSFPVAWSSCYSFLLKSTHFDLKILCDVGDAVFQGPFSFDGLTGDLSFHHLSESFRQRCSPVRSLNISTDESCLLFPLLSSLPFTGECMMELWSPPLPCGLPGPLHLLSHDLLLVGWPFLLFILQILELGRAFHLLIIFFSCFLQYLFVFIIQVFHLFD